MKLLVNIYYIYFETSIYNEVWYVVTDDRMCVKEVKFNLVARARDPLWEESWGSGKKPKRMHGIHCIHYYRIQYTRQARNI